jgi:hypothetical protein
MLSIDNAKKAKFEITVDYSSVGATNKAFGKNFFESVFSVEENVGVNWSAVKIDNSAVEVDKPKDWKTGTITFSLLS